MTIFSGVSVNREHVHLIGIGGTGMTALAGLLQTSGCRVSGSDGALYPPTSDILESLGLEVPARFSGRSLLRAEAGSKDPIA